MRTRRLNLSLSTYRFDHLYTLSIAIGSRIEYDLAQLKLKELGYTYQIIEEEYLPNSYIKIFFYRKPT